MRGVRAAAFTILATITLAGNLDAQLAGFRTSYKYIGNTQSHLLHLIYYHHLPPDAYRLNFETLDEALTAGFRKCPICFPPTPLIPAYDFERRLGMETAGVVDHYYPVPVDQPYTEKLRRAGNEIILHWPLPLKGYHYSFLAVQSEEIKAFSCATGLIYVTTGLMDIIESKSELDMVLAHEVAHIEERHAMNEFQSSREPLFENDPVYVATRLNEFARSLVLIGYTDVHEREADFYALAYGMHRYGADHTALSLVLQKLQDVQWRDIRVGGGLFSGRSNLEGRIQAIQETRIQTFRPKANFYRRRDSEVPDARISLLFQKLYQGQITLFASIESQETLPFNSQGRSQLVIETTDNRSYTLNPDNISFIRKPPEGMENEIDHHTYIIACTKGGEDKPLPITRDSIRKIILTKSQNSLLGQPIAVFVP